MKNILVVATHNAHKIREIGEILSDFEIVADDPKDIEENAPDFVGNALIKVRAIAAKHPGVWCMADDSGLEVAALGGAPGVRSARYAGEPSDTEKNNALLLKNLDGQENRKANFTCAIALVDPSGREHVREGKCFGSISRSPSGAKGFGYDPLFIPDGYTRSFAELSADEKNAISHRGRALAAVRELFSVVTLRGISRSFDSVPVLRSISLSIPRGAFVSVMGPSGSGKSTLLHVIAGLLDHDTGDVRVNGRIGVVFQAFNLIEGRTVRENILLPKRIEKGVLGLLSSVKLSTKDEKRYEDLLSLLELKSLENKKPEHLSGGERQRVAIARALFMDPVILLADEPTGNLDARATKEICSVFSTLRSSTQAAILVVTHDPQVAATADMVLFIKDGEIVSSYPTEHDAKRVSELYLSTYR